MSSVSSWTWLFVDRTSGRCLLCEGKTRNFSSRAAVQRTNAMHLAAKHSITESSKEVAEARAHKLEIDKQTLANFMERKSSDEKFLDYMMFYAVPLQRCEDQIFQDEHPTSPKTRATMRDRLLKHSNRRYNEALTKLHGQSVTLAFDIGTIWSKYLCVVALAFGKRPLVVALEAAETMPATWMSEVLQLLFSRSFVKKESSRSGLC